jgi:hypothetical protein
MWPSEQVNLNSWEAHKSVLPLAQCNFIGQANMHPDWPLNSKMP